MTQEVRNVDCNRDLQLRPLIADMHDQLEQPIRVEKDGDQLHLHTNSSEQIVLSREQLEQLLKFASNKPPQLKSEAATEHRCYTTLMLGTFDELLKSLTIVGSGKRWHLYSTAHSEWRYYQVENSNGSWVVISEFGVQTSLNKNNFPYWTDVPGQPSCWVKR